MTRLHQPQPGAHLGELVEDVHEQEALGEGERLELEYRGLVAREVEAPHGRLLGVQQVQDLQYSCHVNEIRKISRYLHNNLEDKNL